MSGDHNDAGSSLASRVRHLEALLEQRGLLDARELEGALEAFLARSSPANGARLVAEAWVDESFRERLLRDANSAIEELRLSMDGGIQPQRLKVVANTEQLHNVVVCTLCSCYPIALLGPSPTWYKSEAYRSRVVRDPRTALSEFGFDLDATVQVNVWDSSAESPIHGPTAATGRNGWPRPCRVGIDRHSQRSDRRGPPVETGSRSSQPSVRDDDPSIVPLRIRLPELAQAVPLQS